jgi:hypothetical protein
MATSTKANTGVIEPAQWKTFFDQFTRDHRGAHATLEVLGEGVGYQVMTEDKPFDGLAADNKDGERNVWITFGSTLEEHLTHGVHNVKEIRLGPPPRDAAAVLEIEGHDNTRTLLTVSRREKYALPPGPSAAETRKPRRK